MALTKHRIPNKAKWAGYNGLQVARKLGLGTNLKLVLDAGDSASYSSGQKWLDLSGNGYDFHRGATSGAEASDPTFNGTAGRLSSGEYFSTDGSDYFTYDAASESWMDNQHKDNAKYTLAFWVYLTATGTTHYLWGQTDGTSATIGVGLFVNIAANAPRAQIQNGGGGAIAMDHNPGAGLAFTSGWNFVAHSLDETDGSAGSRLVMNAATSTQSGVITSPSAAAATYATRIGGSGSGGLAFPSGERIAIVWAWEGVALSLGQLMALREATRGRFNA